MFTCAAMVSKSATFLPPKRVLARNAIHFAEVCNKNRKALLRDEAKRSNVTTSDRFFSSPTTKNEHEEFLICSNTSKLWSKINLKILSKHRNPNKKSFASRRSRLNWDLITTCFRLGIQVFANAGDC